MKELLTYALKFYSLIPACLVQFVIIMTIKETAKSGNEVFVQQDYRSPIGASRMKTMDVSLLFFIALEISKYVTWKCIYIVQEYIYSKHRVY